MASARIETVVNKLFLTAMLILSVVGAYCFVFDVKIEISDKILHRPGVLVVFGGAVLGLWIFKKWIFWLVREEK